MIDAFPGGRSVWVPLCLTVCCAFAGCTWYRAEPLTPTPTATTQADLARIRIDPATMPLPELAAHRFDPSGGFDIDDVAMLEIGRAHV